MIDAEAAAARKLQPLHAAETKLQRLTIQAVAADVQPLQLAQRKAEQCRHCQAAQPAKKILSMMKQYVEPASSCRRRRWTIDYPS